MEKNKMGIAPIPKLITMMSLPVIFSMMIQAMYNVVDSIFVSKYSEDALTAVSLAFPMQLIVIAAFVGLSTGVNSAISRKLGEKKPEDAALIAEHGVLIAAILYSVVALLGAFVVKYLFTGFSIGNYTFNGFTDNQQIVDYSIIYIRIVMIFSFGSIFNHAGMSIFQGTGEMIKPMISQLIGAVVNIILDPILIFGWFGLPAMGIQGAAIATVTAQIIAMTYMWIQLLKGHCILHLNFKRFKYNGHMVRQILVVGIPSAIMQGLGSIMLLSMNLILSTFGDTAITVMGIYFKVQSMVFMPVFGLSIGTLPVIGYNYGAHNKKRMSQAIRFSVIVAISFMTFCFLIFQLIPKQLIDMFSDNPEMFVVGIPAFRRISLIFPFVGITIIFSTAFQAFGKAYYSLLISAIRQLVVLIPVSYLLSTLGNVDYVWFAFIIAELIGVSSTVILFMNTYHKGIEHWEIGESIKVDE